MVVGLGNTAADVSTSLVGTASKIYLAHRLGSIVVSTIRRRRRRSPELTVL